MTQWRQGRRRMPFQEWLDFLLLKVPIGKASSDKSQNETMALEPEFRPQGVPCTYINCLAGTDDERILTSPLRHRLRGIGLHQFHQNRSVLRKRIFRMHPLPKSHL